MATDKSNVSVSPISTNDSVNGLTKLEQPNKSDLLESFNSMSQLKPKNIQGEPSSQQPDKNQQSAKTAEPAPITPETTKSDPPNTSIKKHIKS